MPESAHRSGVAALLGAPNAGKSTLLNRLLGEKLAIVTPKPQTTRARTLGILTLPRAQVLLVDTPGVHEGTSELSRGMNEAIAEAAQDCDVAVLLVDLGRGLRPALAELACGVRARRTPLLLVGTQLDRPGARERRWPPPGAPACDVALRLSARTGEGVKALLDALVRRLPEAPPYYPDDQLTDRPLRFLAGELVREAAFEVLEQELPYDLAVEVESYDESRPDLLRIRTNLLVRRASQKRIVVGAGGATAKEIGTRARKRIEALTGTHVHLELWVKLEPDWPRNRKRLESLGYC